MERAALAFVLTADTREIIVVWQGLYHADQN
jgi:hypothetical protein